MHTADAIEMPTCDRCQDAWTWLVVYSDGSVLWECRGGGEHHPFKAIDLPRVTTMTLLPRQPHLMQVAVKIEPSTMRPIFFRRHSIELQMSDTQLAKRDVIHCLGWQSTELINNHQHNSQSFTFLFEDGSIVLSNDRNAV